MRGTFFVGAQPVSFAAKHMRELKRTECVLNPPICGSDVKAGRGAVS